MTEPLDLDALEALEKAATPGPWWVASSGDPSWDKKVLGPFRSAEMPTRTEAGVLSYGGHVEERNRPGNNADLIVAARNVLPELIRRARLLDEAVALLRERPAMGCCFHDEYNPTHEKWCETQAFLARIDAGVKP